MNEEKFLSKNAFDNIIASLEALRTEMQNLVASVDPLNDPQVIADIQSVADQLAEILTVAGISGDITTVAGESANITVIADNITQIQSIVDELQDILAVAAELPAIQTVAGDTAAVNAVAGAIVAVQEVAANIQAVIDAVQAAEDAEQARDDAQTWAEGDDPAVELLGGTHSAKTWAEISEQHTREGIRFLGTVDDLENLPPNPDDGDAYFYSETVGDNAIGYGVVWSESAAEWIIFQMGATLIPGTMLPDQEAAPAAANQTTFGGFSANPAMSLVMINRIEQESDTYTFDGNQIVFNEGLSAGDIVRVRQWRTQVSFEDLPDVETLGAEDKIPVQTSQGSGVVDSLALLSSIHSNYRFDDLYHDEAFTATQGSGVYTVPSSANNYHTLSTGEDPNSMCGANFRYRGQYYPDSNITRKHFSHKIGHFFTLHSTGMSENSEIFARVVGFNDRFGGWSGRGYGMCIKGTRIWLQSYESSGGIGLIETDTGIDLAEGIPTRFAMQFRFKENTLELFRWGEKVAELEDSDLVSGNSNNIYLAGFSVHNHGDAEEIILQVPEIKTIYAIP